MQIREFIREHKAAGIAASGFGTVLILLGLSTAIQDALGIVQLVTWLLTSTGGKATLIGLGLSWIIWFWVLFPWLIDLGSKSKISRLCSRLDTLSVHKESTHPYDFIHRSMAAGAIVVKLKGCGAFRDDVELEETIDIAMRGQLIVQAGCKNPKDPSAQGEYQAFWIARKASAEKVDQEGDVEITAETMEEGCRLIAANVRNLWRIGLTAPVDGPVS